MGACGNKNPKKKEGTTIIAKVNKPIDVIQPERVVNNVSQQVQKNGAILTKTEIKEVKPQKDLIKKLKIKFISDEAVIYEGMYTDDTLVKSIIKDSSDKMRPLLLNTDIEYPDDFDLYLVSNKISSEYPNSMKEMMNITTMSSEKIQSLIPPNSQDTQEIIIQIVKSGLDISHDVRKALIDNTNILASPKYESNPFEVIIFEKKTNNLIYYLIQDPSFDFIRYFSNFSAYCNGYNKLFISGGAFSENEFIPTFVELDLFNISQPNHIKKLPNLIFPRSWHSMIFVPPKYVFIVGGSNTKAVEIYNTETNEIKNDSNLNENRSEPTLCVVNNSYLFAFCGFLLMHDFVNSIEKCNLRKKKRTWEIVNLKFDRNFIFEPSFFTVAYEKGNSIVLLGGHERKGQKIGRNYIFQQVGDECIIDNYSLNEMEDSYVCSEKFFTPLDDKVSVLIPSYMSDTVKIVHFNGEMGLLYQMKFEAIVEAARDERQNQGSHIFGDRERQPRLENFPKENL